MKLYLSSVLIRIKYRLVTAISVNPFLYYSLRKMTGTMNRLCVGEDTELVIEGYPRSANSTTVYGFLDRQPKPVKVAHHKHHAAQLLFAKKHNIPAVMLIRQPEQAVLSNLALVLEARKRNPNGKKGTLSFHDVLLAWLIFYRAVEHCTDAFVIAPFEEVTQDIDRIIRQVNRKFGTDFSEELISQAEVKSLGWHATPNELRNAIKDELSEKFAQALTRSSQLRKMLAEANTLHQKFIMLAKSQYSAIDQH